MSLEHVVAAIGIVCELKVGWEKIFLNPALPLIDLLKRD
jgi:hypothetical protein